MYSKRKREVEKRDRDRREGERGGSVAVLKYGEGKTGRWQFHVDCERVRGARGLRKGLTATVHLKKWTFDRSYP
ncbi:hypothetical protein GJAV_G00223850 [Gymnothorax javanicus]|nr:hypothetical protein GJAV_G00223850 [Gymnothorax javanicus]